jgi:hypothetical protein
VLQLINYNTQLMNFKNFWSHDLQVTASNWTCFLLQLQQAFFCALVGTWSASLLLYHAKYHCIMPSMPRGLPAFMACAPWLAI